MEWYYRAWEPGLKIYIQLKSLSFPGGFEPPEKIAQAARCGDRHSWSLPCGQNCSKRCSLVATDVSASLQCVIVWLWMLIGDETNQFQISMGKRPKGLLEISEVSKQSSRWVCHIICSRVAFFLQNFSSKKSFFGRSGKLGPVLTSFHHGKNTLHC